LQSLGEAPPQKSVNISMPVEPRRLPLAVNDIVTAAEWYDDQEPGLGDEFVMEVDEVIMSLAENPHAHSIRFGDVRCARLKKFWRYGVYYFVWENEVIIFSVFHGSREPDLLRERRTRPGES
jgi:plasmid stabilization system protein ParE